MVKTEGVGDTAIECDDFAMIHRTVLCWCLDPRKEKLLQRQAV